MSAFCLSDTHLGICEFLLKETRTLPSYVVHSIVEGRQCKKKGKKVNKQETLDNDKCYAENKNKVIW